MTVNTDILSWLQAWYADQCDGDWEHDDRIKIYNIDNPGWMLEVGLLDTDLEDKPFEKIKVDRSEEDWLHCWVKDRTFLDLDVQVDLAAGTRPQRLGLRVAVLLDGSASEGTPPSGADTRTSWRWGGSSG